MNKKKMWALYAFLAAVLYVVINTLIPAGVFKSIQQNPAGAVTTYEGIYGPEDMDLDDATGKLYISSSNRWKTLRGFPAPMDGIYVLDVDSASQPRRMHTNYPGEFHPHGISLLNSGMQTLLFAVNHNSSGDFVEVFRIANDSLLHQQSISDPSLCCPNDVVAVSPDKFYVTNDHGSEKGFSRTMEDYGRLPYASVKYYDGKSFAEAASGLRYANGVNVNADGTRVYVAATTGRNLLTYARDMNTGALKHLTTQSLKSGVDNIDVDADGNLWIAAHPKLLAFVGHAKDSTKLSPSQVFRLSPGGNDTYVVDEVLMDDGTGLSGSSIAVRYKNQLFVGGVFQPRILRITLASPK
jgi:arylesterase/paraoxonase